MACLLARRTETKLQPQRPHSPSQPSRNRQPVERTSKQYSTGTRLSNHRPIATPPPATQRQPKLDSPIFLGSARLVARKARAPLALPLTELDPRPGQTPAQEFRRWE